MVKNGTLGNAGQINASGTGNALDNEQITNTGGIEIAALGALTLDLLTTVTNTSHTITVDDTGTLTLQGDASITGGSISNSGTVDIEGTGATLDGVAVTGGGAIDVDAAAPATLTTLVLEDTTSITNGTLTVGPTGILSVAGDVTLDHVGVTNQNSIEVTAGNALTLDDATTLDNSAGTVTIDGTGKLTLNDAEITGGIPAAHHRQRHDRYHRLQQDRRRCGAERRPCDHRGPSGPDAGWRHGHRHLVRRRRQRRDNPG